MKQLILLMLLCLSFTLNAQNQKGDKGPLLRVYDLKEKKMAKGKYYSISDSTITFTKNGISEIFSVKSIGTVKINRSNESKILVPAAISGGIFGLMGLALETDSFFNLDNATAVGFLGGAAFGALVGSLTISKNKKYYKIKINGNRESWDVFVNTMTNY